MKSRIMYIEYKGDVQGGAARIGRVRFSKTGKTLYYDGSSFRRRVPIEIDDARDEYWTKIRELPANRANATT